MTSVTTLKIIEEVPPLLRLPPLVWRRIYRFVGLVPFSNYPYGIGLYNGKARWWPEVKPRIFSGSLLSCRIIHAKEASLLYSLYLVNRFVLRYDPTCLEPFGPLYTRQLQQRWGP